VVAALRDGAGIDGVLDTAIHAVSDRMLRYDTAGEFDFADDFGWLDITHGLTYAAATRWHHDRTVEGANDSTPELLRLAMFTAFLAQWTGRHEWHTRVGDEHEVEPLGPDLESYGADLQRSSMLDGTTAFIVHAHAVKTSRAAAVEAVRRNSRRPLDATAGSSPRRSSIGSSRRPANGRSTSSTGARNATEPGALGVRHQCTRSVVQSAVRSSSVSSVDPLAGLDAASPAIVVSLTVASAMISLARRI
jgi:hypothetical protein